MGTVKEKLQYTLDSKNAIKHALIGKGIQVTDDIGTYAQNINDISSGPSEKYEEITIRVAEDSMDGYSDYPIEVYVGEGSYGGRMRFYIKYDEQTTFKIKEGTTCEITAINIKDSGWVGITRYTFEAVADKKRTIEVHWEWNGPFSPEPMDPLYIYHPVIHTQLNDSIEDSLVLKGVKYSGGGGN